MADLNQYSLGHVWAAWRVSDNIADHIKLLEAYNLILEYLVFPKVGPLPMAFTQNRKPLAHNIKKKIYKLKEPLIIIKFTRVPVERMHDIAPKLDEVLKSIIKKGPQNFDLEKISLELDKLVLAKNLENNLHNIIFEGTRLDQLYGENPGNFESFVRGRQNIEKYYLKREYFWMRLIENLLLKRKKLIVLGKPSQRKAKSLVDAEKARLENQIMKLGPSGLRKKQIEYESAVQSHEAPGVDVLGSFPVSDVNDISFWPIRTYNKSNPGFFDLKGLPYRIKIDDVSSIFVWVYIFFDTKSLSTSQKPLLPLLLNLWFDVPSKIIRSSKKDIKLQKKNRTSSFGLPVSNEYSHGDFGHSSIVVKLCTKRAIFQHTIAHLSHSIRHPHFTNSDIVKLATKLIDYHLQIPTDSETTHRFLRFLHSMSQYNNQSNFYYNNYIHRKKILKQVLIQAKSKPESVTEKLYKMIKTLTDQKNTFVYIAADTEALIKNNEHKLTALQTLIPPPSAINEEILKEKFLLSSDLEFIKVQASRHVIYRLASTESYYLRQSVDTKERNWTRKEVE